ncbi:hypothetical protein PVK06_004064 [Gossypium arboreum]|uniref:Uncharacterized protein n=1 Tax=Gossypium arboreum TaxID=29729 RepID=A0ABR0QQZ3_GOSAR|nr:hypothetical protein PVK06_004064 [Gossypium arboreum]
MINQFYHEKWGVYMIIIFYKPQYFMQCGKSTQLGSFPTAWIHKVFLDDIINSDFHYREIQKFLCQFNKIVPFEIWPPPDVTAPLDTWPVRYKLYHKEILKAIQEYYENILDPSEWSQDYPWYYSQINLNKRRIQDEQEDKSEDEDMCKDDYSESSLNSAQFPHSNANS